MSSNCNSPPPNEIISYSFPQNNSLSSPCKLNDSWPTQRSHKKGENQIFGDLDTNVIRADHVYTYPETIYVPGNYPNLDSALKSIKDHDSGGPIAGTQIILKPGVPHHLTSDYVGEANFIRITAPTDDVLPTMGNFYGQDIGQNHKVLERNNRKYNYMEGGLGPYKLEVCNQRITVTGQVNPNFNRLKSGDILNWIDASGSLTSHQVISADFNSIFISAYPSQAPVREGEGFWISPRVTVQPIGPRKVINQSRLEWRGIYLNCPVEDGSNRFMTGAGSGYNRLKYCFVSGDIGLVGSADSPFPNVYTGTVHHPGGSSGQTFFQSFVGCSAQLISDGWNGGYLGATFSGNVRGVYNWNCGTIGLNGSTFHNCQLGAQTRFANLNVPGCIFSFCDTGAECQAGKLNSRDETSSLPSLFIRNCNLGFSYNQSCRGDHRNVYTSNNGIDLIVDGDEYPNWGQFPSNSHGKGFSYLYYDGIINVD